MHYADFANLARTNAQRRREAGNLEGAEAAEREADRLARLDGEIEQDLSFRRTLAGGRLPPLQPPADNHE